MPQLTLIPPSKPGDWLRWIESDEYQGEPCFLNEPLPDAEDRRRQFHIVSTTVTEEKE